MFKEAVFKDQVAIVSGGSRGLGRATVLALAQQGMHVFFTYVRAAEQAQVLVAQVKAAGGNAQALQLDVRDSQACAATVEEIYQQTGRIDLLVNNSGIVKDSLLMGMDDDAINDVLATNVAGAMYLSRAVVPFMTRARAGHIINISSTVAEKPGRGHSNYAASKGAISAFTKAMAVELSKRKIRVNAIAPGMIETDMTEEVRDLAADEVKSKILLGRYGQPEDVANCISFLASPYGSYINGEIIHVDGGFKMA